MLQLAGLMADAQFEAGVVSVSALLLFSATILCILPTTILLMVGRMLVGCLSAWLCACRRRYLPAVCVYSAWGITHFGPRCIEERSL